VKDRSIWQKRLL